MGERLELDLRLGDTERDLLRGEREDFLFGDLEYLRLERRSYRSLDLDLVRRSFDLCRRCNSSLRSGDRDRFGALFGGGDGEAPGDFDLILMTLSSDFATFLNIPESLENL